MGLALWVVVGVAQTTSYLGLPFEPKPVYPDCYESMTWDGHKFHHTGITKCLGSER